MTGVLYRVACGVVENSEVSIAVNATTEDSASFGTKGPVTDTFETGRNVTTGSDYWQGVGDHPIIYDTVSSSVIQDDYDAQPWS